MGINLPVVPMTFEVEDFTGFQVVVVINFHRQQADGKSVPILNLLGVFPVDGLRKDLGESALVGLSAGIAFFRPSFQQQFWISAEVKNPCIQNAVEEITGIHLSFGFDGDRNVCAVEFNRFTEGAGHSGKSCCRWLLLSACDNQFPENPLLGEFYRSNDEKSTVFFGSFQISEARSGAASGRPTTSKLLFLGGIL